MNAVVQTAFAKALDEANRIDELMRSDGFNSDSRYTVENMPYLGVPMTCKEIIFCKVQCSTCFISGVHWKFSWWALLQYCIIQQSGLTSFSS